LAKLDFRQDQFMCSLTSRVEAHTKLVSFHSRCTNRSLQRFRYLGYTGPLLRQRF
jgi:hypothetical protein